MNIIKTLEKEQIQKRAKQVNIPKFAPGDTVKVNVKVKEGARERIQAYEGVCIARKSSGINSSFTVRKISNGEGVERVFPLFSPLITVDVVRRGKVRRAKLYYLRDLAGKKARIAERKTGVDMSGFVDFGVKVESEAPVAAEAPATEAAAAAPAEEVKAEEAPKAE